MSISAEKAVAYISEPHYRDQVSDGWYIKHLLLKQLVGLLNVPELFFCGVVADAAEPGARDHRSREIRFQSLNLKFGVGLRSNDQKTEKDVYIDMGAAGAGPYF